MKRSRNQRGRARLKQSAIGAAVVVFQTSLDVSSAAAQSAAPNLSCLWTSLSVAEQLNLEVAARSERGLAMEDIAQIGEERLADLLDDCGFAWSEASIAAMARYWAAKADEPARRSALAQTGVDIAAADQALVAAAPASKRVQFAAEISARVDGEAAAAVRNALGLLETAMGGLDDAARRAAAEYFISIILADGLAAAPIE